MLDGRSYGRFCSSLWIGLACGLAVPLHALISPDPLMDDPLWAPATALGPSSLSALERPESLYFNPAALSLLEAPQLRFSHGLWSGNATAESLAYGQALGNSGALGMGMSSGQAGSPSAYEGALSAALAWGAFDAGLGVRAAGAAIGTRPALSADLGLLWRAKRWPLTLNAALLRLPWNSTDSGDRHHGSLGAAWSFSDLGLNLDAQDRGGDLSLQAGAEWRVLGLLALRGSVGRDKRRTSLAAGLGVSYGPDLDLDYAVLAGPEQAPQHCLSVGYRFVHGGKGFWDKPTHERPALVQERQDHAPGGQRMGRIPPPSPDSAPGDFELDAAVAGRSVSLRWNAPADKEALSYTVTMGMLPAANFKALPDPPAQATAWTGEMGLQGVTYYFRVISTRPDGSQGPSSSVLAVPIP